MKQYPVICILLAFLLLAAVPAEPCSMFKITLYGKTMVGNNEDAWRLGSRIWFETGKEGHFGAAYVGHEDAFPQGGLNEAGLVYDGFAVYPRKLRPATGKKAMGNITAFLKTVLQCCATVQEVQSLLNQVDRSSLNGSMLLYVDKSGEYLVVEADTTILGHDKKYVLSNFCPSVTPNLEDVKIDRYKRGRAFLQNTEDTSLGFCLAVMDTMHECRRHVGDGTLYTSIYDLDAGSIYLYFYHDYQHGVSFNLKQELSKGDHVLLMASLFPPNPEYIRFTQYKTPFNDARLRKMMPVIWLFLLFTLPCFLFIYLRERRWRSVWPALLLMNSCLACYIHTLLEKENKAIYYFDAPYREDGHVWLNLSSYLPFVLLLLFLPVVYIAIRNIRRSGWNKFYLALYSVNTLNYALLLVLFGYWGLLS